MKKLFSFIFYTIMITSLFGCATKQDTINYLNNYVHKNISENCINIFSNQRYNEYIDTVTNIKYYVYIDYNSNINITDKRFPRYTAR